MTYETEIANIDARYLRGDLSTDEYDRIYGNINERYGVEQMKLRFRGDNTNGYSAADLEALNEAFEKMMRNNYNPYNLNGIEYKSWQDHVAEIILGRYDAGKRGDDLTR